MTLAEFLAAHRPYYQREGGIVRVYVRSLKTAQRVKLYHLTDYAVSGASGELAWLRPRDIARPERVTL